MSNSITNCVTGTLPTKQIIYDCSTQKCRVYGRFDDFTQIILDNSKIEYFYNKCETRGNFGTCRTKRILTFEDCSVVRRFTSHSIYVRPEVKVQLTSGDSTWGDLLTGTIIIGLLFLIGCSCGYYNSFRKYLRERNLERVQLGEPSSPMIYDETVIPPSFHDGELSDS